MLPMKTEKTFYELLDEHIEKIYQKQVQLTTEKITSHFIKNAIGKVMNLSSLISKIT
jgi:hypothetical protein